MIPRTRTLFNMMKKYMGNATSFLNVLFYLQPFMINSDDITFKQYEEIVNFMRTNILNFKKQLVKNNTSYINYISHKYKDPRAGTGNFNTNFKNSYLFRLLSTSEITPVELLYKLAFKDDEAERYLDRVQRYKVSTAEFIKRIYTTDYAQLFTNAISLEDIDLFVGMDVDSIIKNKLEDLTSEKKTQEGTSELECKNFTLAKYYIDIDTLKEDDGNPDVYFDTKYDDTRYDIIKEFEGQQATMSPSAFNDFFKVSSISLFVGQISFK